MKRRLARPLVVAALALGTFLAPGWAAYALWSSTATATLTGVTTAAAPAAPGKPTGLACTGTATKVLTWTAGAGGAATSYTVYRDNGASDVTVGTSGTTSLTITEAMMGSPIITNGKYTLYVTATNITGTSAASASFQAMMKPSQQC